MIGPGTRIGPFEVLSLAGAGGMGKVYRARDTRLDRDVAIKVLAAEVAADPERLRRFEREGRATAALSHPNILAVHDVGTYEGVPYLVEELLEGESLEDRLARGALAVPDAVRMGVEIARGLAAAHEKGVVHRDLKPGNVFLTRSGTVKVIDFGLAKLVGPSTASATTAAAMTIADRTELGKMLGTVAYMAPEQARGEPIDPRTDVFAFGMVLFEMLAGRRPFTGPTASDTLASILKDEPPPLPGTVPPRIVAVVHRCLAKEPGARYQRGSEVLAALEAVQTGSTLAPAPRTTGSGSRFWWLAGAAALGAVVAIVAGLAAFDLRALRSRLGGPAGAPARAVKLAVLPFANLSGDSEQEYLSDGLTQEMIAQLGRLHPQSLSVIARTSVMRYRKTDTPIDQIGRDLGVDYVLEGSAQQEGGRVRIVAELIQVRDQTQLWAETFERELSGILVMQSEVARKVASALALQLLPAEQARLASARSVDPEAYEAFLKGRHYWIKMTKADLDTAEAYTHLALQRDSNFAEAWAGLAFVWAAREQMGFASHSVAGPKVEDAALKAISLDDTVAESHYALAALWTWTDWDFPAAEKEWKRAIELDPNRADGLTMYSLFLAIMGRPDEAVAQIDRALSLDPFNVTIHSFRALDLVCARRYDEAITQAREALRMQPDAPLAALALSYALHGKNLHDEAIAVTGARWAAEYPDVKAALERGYAEEGYAGAWRRAAEVEAENHGEDPGADYSIATKYAIAGESVRALDWLEKAYRAKDPNLPYVSCYPVWDSLRAEPRFQTLLRLMKLPAR